MHIAISAPLSIRLLAPWLEIIDEDGLPEGLGAPSVTLLAQSLLEAGHRLTLATLDSHTHEPVVFEGPGLRLHVGPNRTRRRSRDFYAKERSYLSSVLVRERPDLVNAQWTYEFALAALETGIPTVVTINDWAPRIFRYMPDPYRAVRLIAHRRVLRTARSLTAVSPYMADRVRGRHRGNVPVTPNGVSDTDFRDEARAVDGDGPTLLSINNGFGKWKNVSALLRAWPSIRRHHPDARLILAGSDHDPAGPAAAFAARNGLGEGVTFVGRVARSDALRMMDSAHLLVHPSLEESFGMVILEAMARRLPVVAGRASGAVPWLLDNGTAGVLTEVRDPGSIARSVCEALGAPDRLTVLAENARRRAWDGFRIDATRSSYERVFAQVAGG